MSKQQQDPRIYLSGLGSGKSPQMQKMMLAIRYLLMLFVTAVMLGPFLWLLYISLRMSGNIYSWPAALSDFSFASYTMVWKEFPMFNLPRVGPIPVPSPFLNSIFIAVFSVFFTVVVASLAAYPLARMDFYGKKIVFMFILSTLMVPFQLYMIPLFKFVTRDLGLTNSYTGIILPFVASVFGIYLIKQFYETIPNDLDEAARVDGADEFRLWWQILLPMTKPAIATLAIFSFVGSWSNFLWPLLILQSDEKMTLPVSIAKLSGAFIDRTSYLAAGSIIAIVPVIIFFLLLQRWFLGGLTVGAVKG